MMKKILLVSLLLIRLIIGSSLAEGFDAFNDEEVSLDIGMIQVQTQQYVNIEENTTLALHRNPQKDSSIINHLIRNQKVTVISTENGWSYIQVDKNEGYVLSRYLSDDRAPENLGTYIINSNGRVKIRKYPNGDFKFYLNPGVEVVILSYIYDEKTNEPTWARIKNESGIGYIKIQFLKEKEETSK